MSERRMFAKSIIDSDSFIDMPMSARLLYYDLGMRADDEGFINAPKKIMRMTGATNDDMNILINKKYIIPFETGVVVIRHWKIHNYIRSDRLIPTEHIEEKSLLKLENNKIYHLGRQMTVKCQSSDSQMSAQDRLGKVSIDKDRLDKISLVKELSEEEIDAMTDEEYANYLEGGSTNGKNN